MYWKTYRSRLYHCMFHLLSFLLIGNSQFKYHTFIESVSIDWCVPLWRHRQWCRFATTMLIVHYLVAVAPNSHSNMVRVAASLPNYNWNSGWLLTSAVWPLRWSAIVGVVLYTYEIAMYEYIYIFFEMLNNAVYTWRSLAKGREVFTMRMGWVEIRNKSFRGGLLPGRAPRGGLPR